MFKKVLLIAALFGIAGQSWALPFLKGDLAFGVAPGASWSATGGTPTAFDPNGVGTATGISFSGSTLPIFSGANAFVTAGSGSFAGTIGSLVNFHNFNFSPLGSQTTLWSFVSGGINYALKMTTANVVSQNSNQINLTGGAILTATGSTNFAPTIGSFQFTANASGSSFSYSSSAQVPEPASLALFGIGILGIGFSQIRRRENNV